MTGTEIYGVLFSLLFNTSNWERRNEIAWYVSRCEMAGFCNTDDQRRACAQRYIAGKRKVTSPGTRRRKTEAKKRKNIKISQELIDAVNIVALSETAAKYLNGNEKAINSMIGQVMRIYKTDPVIVKTMLLERLAK